jgi:hypothetical protein
MMSRLLTRSDLSPSPVPPHVLCLPRPPPSITASFDARRYTAATLRLSFRAISVVFVFSRASVLSIRTSSFVHGRLRVIFLAIFFPMRRASNFRALPPPPIDRLDTKLTKFEEHEIDKRKQLEVRVSVIEKHLGLDKKIAA